MQWLHRNRISHSYASAFLQNYASHFTDLIADALILKLPFIYFQHLAALEEKETQNHEGCVCNRPFLCLASWRKCRSKSKANKPQCTGYVSVMTLSFAYFYFSCSFVIPNFLVPLSQVVTTCTALTLK